MTVANNNNSIDTKALRRLAATHENQATCDLMEVHIHNLRRLEAQLDRFVKQGWIQSYHLRPVVGTGYDFIPGSEENNVHNFSGSFIMVTLDVQAHIGVSVSTEMGCQSGRDKGAYQLRLTPDDLRGWSACNEDPFSFLFVKKEYRGPALVQNNPATQFAADFVQSVFTKQTRMMTRAIEAENTQANKNFRRGLADTRRVRRQRAPVLS